MTPFFFFAWLVGLAAAGVLNAVASADNPRVLRAGRVGFAVVLTLDLCIAAVAFPAGAYSFWWLTAIGCGVPLACITGIAVRRAYAGHRLTLVSAVLTTAALYFAFPLGLVDRNTAPTGLGRFEHTHHALDVIALLIPALIVLAGEALRGRVRVAPDEEGPSIRARLRRTPRSVVLGGTVAFAVFIWLLGADSSTVLPGLGGALVVFAVYAWWSSRAAERRMRRSFE